MKSHYLIAALVLAGGTAFLIFNSTGSGPDDGKVSANGHKGTRDTLVAPPAMSDGRSTASRPKRPKVKSGETKGGVDDMAGILRQGNPLERNRAFLKWMDDLAVAEIPTALEQMRALGLMDSRRSEYALLLSYWASQDPTAALADVMSRGNSQRSVEIILDTWARNDPEAAITWAQAAHPDDPGNSHLAAVLGRLASSDPARVNALLATIPEGKPQDEAISQILRNSLIEGPEAARTWIDSIQDEKLRGNAIVQVAGDMARIDPEGTAAWLAGLGGTAVEDGTFHLMAEWQQKDAAAAAAYFAGMPAGTTRSRALGGIIASLSRDNPRSAIILMDQYPGDASEAVVGEFLNGAARSDPAFAVNHIHRISDPEQRNAALDRVLSRWMRRDRAAAVSWIQANPVPPEIQRNLGIGM